MDEVFGKHNLDTWAAGLDKADSTVASYKKNIRLHIKPYIGAVPLASLTTAKINEMYRAPEAGGRKDHRTGEGLSVRTRQYIHTILKAALKAAVEAEPALLAKNPADKARAPKAKAVKAATPEMHLWTDDQLKTFLGWSGGSSSHHTAWYVLAMTGMRRGVLLALRWRDVDLDAGRISIRRSVGVTRTKGEGVVIPLGPDAHTSMIQGMGSSTNEPRVFAGQLSRRGGITGGSRRHRGRHGRSGR
jgi:integrase